MIKIYPHSQLGHFHNDWLDSRHHFSFGEYFAPDRMEFGTLRVINDDTIKAGTGFSLHPHKDMEIITFVRKGTIIHRDSLGNEGRTNAGDVQVMSAGTGISHAEYADPDCETQIFQIWIRPNKTGVTPRWETAEFRGKKAAGHLPVLVSGFEKDIEAGALFINQNARISGGVLAQDTVFKKPSAQYVYLLVSTGEIAIDQHILSAGDGAEVTGQDYISIQARLESEVLIIEV